MAPAGNDQPDSSGLQAIEHDNGPEVVSAFREYNFDPEPAVSSPEVVTQHYFPNEKGFHQPGQDETYFSPVSSLGNVTTPHYINQSAYHSNGPQHKEQPPLPPEKDVVTETHEAPGLPTRRPPRICGVKRTVFILVCVLAVVAVIAVVLGAVLGTVLSRQFITASSNPCTTSIERS
ncbi:hypothetical protein K431DRAFT_89859 [Polychaeton citri CBS 116435]|uniref:Uncharacterized protein n=1 Tax=Polychaeton citri CBS 116435 TaxID=1314669 RepID=A0A9P4Q4Q8_9PEZI|nr:hypothetical protein K431DRAFT_89859 [Polychaeton citri CBS 116435]